ncbi:MAG: DegV family protein, partial [Anaerolineaceae bacterium]|nr:DegV family protein [Anaerolineaceae bacterium]
ATYNAAKMAAETFPERDIRVIDSLTLTLGQGFMAIRAAEMAREGVSVDEIVETVEGMRGRLHVFAALSTLKYLAMGGRMGKFTAGMADTLNIKPVLTVVDGKLEMLEKIRTKHKATKRVLELIENAVDGKPIEQIGIIHAADRAGAENYQTMLHELFPAYQGDVLIAPFTPGLSVHAGAGFAGVVILTKE